MPRKDGEVLLGQLYDRELDMVVRFTETAMQEPAANALQVAGAARTEISPMDGHASLVRVYELPGLTNVFIEFPGVMNLVLPDVLTGISVTFNKSQGAGEDIHQIGDVVWEGPSGGMTLTPSSRAQASVAIIPDISPTVVQTWGQNIPTINLAFYMTGNITDALILAQVRSGLTITITNVVSGTCFTGTNAHRLKVGQEFQFPTLITPGGTIAVNTTYFVRTVIDEFNFTYSHTLGGALAAGDNAGGGTLAPNIKRLPVFKPQSHSFTLKGEQISLSQNADSLMQYSWSPDQVSYAITPVSGTRSDGFSNDRGVSIRTVTLSPTIHGGITLSSPTDTAVAQVVVRANVPPITGIGDAPSFAGVTNEPTALTATANASVTPTSFSPVSGLSAIPTVGLYLVDVNIRPYAGYGHRQVIVTLVDFSIFA